jgi:hypothetical protein
VVLGVVETYWNEPGKRLMQGVAEGADPVPIDVVAQSGHGAPAVYVLEAHDADRNGWLEAGVRPADQAPDRSTVLSGVWILPESLLGGRSVEAVAVAQGADDLPILHRFDVGAERSETRDRLFLPQIAEFCERVQALGESELLSTWLGPDELDRRLGPVALLTRSLEVALAKRDLDALLGPYTEAKEALAPVTTELGAHALAALAPTPVWRKPAVFRMVNPGMGILTVTVADTLNLTLNNSFHAESVDARPHDWFTGFRFGGIAVRARSPFQDLSRGLDLGYDLALTGVDYDPGVTTVGYLDGAVQVRTLRQSGFLVEAIGRNLGVAVHRGTIEERDGVWFERTRVREAESVCGLVFDADPGVVREAMDRREEVPCTRFAVVWGDSAEQMLELAAGVRDWDRVRAEAREWLAEATDAVHLSGPPALCRQVEIGQRVLETMQFAAGGIYAAPDGGYEAIWVRDSANAFVFPALAGNPRWLHRWAEYLFANPTPVEWRGDSYRAFLTFVHRDQTQSWQQAGTFYAALTAYADWKLNPVEPAEQASRYDALVESHRFLHDNSFDPDLGLYSEWYINEAFLKGAHDWAAQYPALKVGDLWPEYIHTIYINSNAYALLVMLAEMAAAVDRPEDSSRWLHAAEDLAESVSTHLWDADRGRYHCGLARLEDGSLVPVDWNYWDIYFDYVWGFSLFPMAPDCERRLASFDALLTERDGFFPGRDTRLYAAFARAHAGYFYAFQGQNDKAWTLLQRLTERAFEIDAHGADTVCAMSGAMPECVHELRGHRPQTFTLGPYLHSAAAFGAQLDYNGVTLNPGNVLHRAERIRFRDSVLDVDLRAPVAPAGVRVGAQRVLGTLKIPSPMLAPGSLEAGFVTDPEYAGPVLLYTPFELEAVESGAQSTRYRLRGYGRGVLRFRDHEVDYRISTAGSAGPPRVWTAPGGMRVELTATGAFQVELRAEP